VPAIAGRGGQDVRAAAQAGGDAAGRDLAGQGRCPRAELSLRSRHGDLRDRRSGVPYFRGCGRSCPGPWPPQSVCPVSTSARTSRWTSPRGQAWARSSGRTKPRIRRPGQQPQHRLGEQVTVSSRPRLVETTSMVPRRWHLAAATFLKTAIPPRPEARSRLLYRAGEPWPGALPLTRLTGTAIRSGPCQHRRIRPGRPRTVLPCAG
jgi:hypothetical protein